MKGPKSGCSPPRAGVWTESFFGQRKPRNFIVHRGETSQGAHWVLATDKGFAPHVVLTTTLGVGLYITYTPQMRKLRPRGARDWQRK